MIYTSYFGSYRGDNGVSIARFYPSNFVAYPDLFPSSKLLRLKKSGMISDDEYKVQYYNEVLNNLNSEKVYSELNEKVLLCYEKAGYFCHRHIVAEWLINNGYKVKEI